MPFAESLTLLLMRIHRRNLSGSRVRAIMLTGTMTCFYPMKDMNPLSCVLATRKFSFSKWIEPYGTYFLYFLFSSSSLLLEFSLKFEPHFFFFFHIIYSSNYQTSRIIVKTVVIIRVWHLYNHRLIYQWNRRERLTAVPSIHSWFFFKADTIVEWRKSKFF